MKWRLLAAVCATTFSTSISAQCVDAIAKIDDVSLQRTRVELVEAATPATGIDILAYIFDLDGAGIDMLRHLASASRKRVPVRLLIDGIGPGPMLPFEDEVIAALHNIAPAFEVRVFHPKENFLKLTRRMHDKLFIVGNTAVIGSSSTWDASVEGWLVERDLLVRGDLVHTRSTLHAMHTHFDEFWASSATIEQKPRQFFPLASPYRTANGFKTLDPERMAQWQRILSEPSSLNSAAAAPVHWMTVECERLRYVHDNPGKAASIMLDDMFATTRTEIVVVSPYLIPVPKIRAMLERKQRDGVHIILVSASLERITAEFPAIGRAYANGLPELAQAGFEVREYRDSRNRILHAKLVRIDGRSYYIGSFNFDPLSAYSNTENGLWIEDGAQLLDPELDRYVSHSVVVTDGHGDLIDSTDIRCNAAGCGGIWRWITPLIRNFL